MEPERLTGEQIAEILRAAEKEGPEGLGWLPALAREVKERRAAELPIPVSERLPSFGVDVLAFDAESDLWLILIRVPGEVDSWWWSPLEGSRDITHWLPLPASPSEAPACPRNPEDPAPKSDWPPAVSDGLSLQCADCGCVPRFDYRVRAEFWARWVSGPDRLGVVCLPCLDARCLGEGLAEALEEVQWTGTRHTVVMRPTLRHEYERRPGSPA